jgi:glutathione S-transferase kappa 1
MYRSKKFPGMKVAFYFDLISPYTYWGWQILKRYKTLWGLEVELRPFHLGAVMASTGNSSPASVPNRAKYMQKDLERNAKWFKLEHVWKGVPSNIFEDFAKITRSVNRLLCVVVEDPSLSEAQKWRVVDCAFTIFWEDPTYRRGDLFEIPSQGGSIIEKIISQGNLDPSLANSIDNKGKDIQKSNSDKAISFGAYGSPTFLIADEQSGQVEMFFGSDRFEQLAYLCGKPWYGPSPPKSLSKF